MPPFDPWLSLGLILLWLLAQAFFSAADTALNAAPRDALKSRAEKGERGAAAALAVIAEKPEMFGRTLIYMGLAEGVAIYGLVMSILLLGKL